MDPSPIKLFACGRSRSLDLVEKFQTVSRTGEKRHYHHCHKGNIIIPALIGNVNKKARYRPVQREILCPTSRRELAYCTLQPPGQRR